MLKEVEFKREMFVKDLYNSAQVLNFIQSIEFESIYTFFESKKLNLFQVNQKQELIIPINTKEEVDIIYRLLSESPMFDYENINLLILPDLVESLLIKDLVGEKKFTITFDQYPENDNINIPKLHAINKNWIENNPIYTRIYIKFNSLRNETLKIIDYYKKTGFRFFELKIDYNSFNEMKMSDIEEVEFWFNYILKWTTTANQNTIKLKTSNNLIKSIFISNDLKLYLDNTKLESSFLFDINLNINKNGEDISLKELNRLRQYLDLDRLHLKIPDNFNTLLINFRENIEIMTSINEIPYTTRLIEGILRVK